MRQSSGAHARQRRRTLISFYLNVYVSALSDGIEDGRVSSQSLQSLHIVQVGLDFELYADFSETLRYIVGKPQIAAQIDVAFNFRFQLLDLLPLSEGCDYTEIEVICRSSSVFR